MATNKVSQTSLNDALGPIGAAKFEAALRAGVEYFSGMGPNAGKYPTESDAVRQVIDEVTGLVQAGFLNEEHIRTIAGIVRGLEASAVATVVGPESTPEGSDTQQ